MPKVKVNNIESYYTSEGEGEPIVLIHGLSGSTRHWVFQIPEFSTSYTVIAYDVRGHGQTDKPRQDYVIRGFADDLAGLLDSLGIEAIRLARSKQAS
ncbi:MAG: alpha/beta fold hydrolase [Candidatus Bathyarchaeota archaeon]|nr:alpha/beta fold hydrolase [Candidatus Bathyarchaeota archaeon]